MVARSATIIGLRPIMVTLRVTIISQREIMVCLRFVKLCLPYKNFVFVRKIWQIFVMIYSELLSTQKSYFCLRFCLSFVSGL